jgi:hypothetical protein
MNMPYSGDRPGKGVYICSICAGSLRLIDEDDLLLCCPDCKGTEFTAARNNDAAKNPEASWQGGRNRLE